MLTRLLLSPTMSFFSSHADEKLGRCEGFPCLDGKLSRNGQSVSILVTFWLFGARGALVNYKLWL